MYYRKHPLCSRERENCQIKTSYMKADKMWTSCEDREDMVKGNVSHRRISWADGTTVTALPQNRATKCCLCRYRDDTPASTRRLGMEQNRNALIESLTSAWWIESRIHRCDGVAKGNFSNHCPTLTILEVNAVWERKYDRLSKKREKIHEGASFSTGDF